MGKVYDQMELELDLKLRNLAEGTRHHHYAGARPIARRRNQNSPARSHGTEPLVHPHPGAGSLHGSERQLLPPSARDEMG